ncbi:MAG TPA: hypothetical protein DIW24_06705 [Bacteroidetes bacterium]|nr:hypothetical protein [Bacteroidota bacterium]
MKGRVPKAYILFIRLLTVFQGHMHNLRKPITAKPPPLPFKKRRLASVTRLVFIGLFGLGLLVGTTAWLTRSTSKLMYETPEAVPEAEAALVLGTSNRTRSGGVNLYFKYRMDAAAALYLTGKVRYLLLSGDHRKDNYNEPGMMRKALRERGVPNRAMKEDGAGLRTLDSVVRAQKVFGIEKMVIVSQRQHLFRALYIAKHEKIMAYGLVAQTPTVTRPTWIRQTAREALARIRVFLDLYLWREKPNLNRNL